MPPSTRRYFPFRAWHTISMQTTCKIKYAPMGLSIFINSACRGYCFININIYRLVFVNKMIIIRRRASCHSNVQFNWVYGGPFSCPFACHCSISSSSMQQLLAIEKFNYNNNNKNNSKNIHNLKTIIVGYCPGHFFFLIQPMFLPQD